MTEAGPTCSRVPSSRYPLALLGFFLLLCVLMHAKSFSVSHIEGDEIVYLTLAREMNWDFSEYSTQHDAAVRRFPHSIYRQELFHHPPLYPLVLKIGMLFQQAVFFGLAFQVLAMALLLTFARRAARLCELPPRLQVVLYAGMTFGPLLMFSTGRLHHDGLLAIFLFCAFTMFFEALEKHSTSKAAVAGALFVLALNVRYNAIAVLPLIVLAQLYQFHREASERVDPGSTGSGSYLSIMRDPRNWSCFLVVSALIVTLGLPHYYRILATYGSLIPSTFIVPDLDAESWNEFVRRAYQRSRPRIAFYLIAIFPLVLTWFTPSYARFVAREVRTRSWTPAYLIIAVFLFAAGLTTMHNQVRYFAPMTPFLFMSFALQLKGPVESNQRVLWALVGLTFLSMLVSSFDCAIFHPTRAGVLPSPFILIPSLAPHYI